VKERHLKLPEMICAEKTGPHNMLDGLPASVAERLLARQRTISLPQGGTLFEKGDAGNGCYWLRQGVLTVSASSARAQQRIIAILGPGAIVGEMAMIDGQPRSATVQAVRNSLLSFVSRAAFDDELSRHPEFYNHIMLTLAARLRQSDEDRVAATFLTVEARVARALLSFARHLGEDIGGRVRILHKVTQIDLAAMAGVSRDSVSSALAVWNRQKIVEGAGRDGYVVDEARLKMEAALK
jgi:CRP/FNR family cyclic AMP-dependent transcriptional regulator